MSLEAARICRADRIPKFSQSLIWPSLPVEIEIGSGVGMHAIRRSIQRPDRHVFAIEKTREKHEKSLSRLQGHQRKGIACSNLTFLNADARSFLNWVCPESSVEEIFLLYPNPNPKNPAQRWVRMPFFQILLSRLRIGGKFSLATNEHWYAMEALYWLESLWKPSSIDLKTLNPVFAKPRSHFERKYFERGETCWNILVTR